MRCRSSVTSQTYVCWETAVCGITLQSKCSICGTKSYHIAEFKSECAVWQYCFSVIRLLVPVSILKMSVLLALSWTVHWS